MFRYSGYALTIHSEVELPELPPGGEKPDVIIRLGHVQRSRTRVSLREDYAFNVAAGSFLIRDGREITVSPRAGTHADTLQALLTGRMMAFLLRQRGWLPLHASSIAIDGHAVLFLGISGAGKSTTAAGFHARGHQVIADDVSAVRVAAGKCVLRPAGARLRLLDDSQAVFRGAGRGEAVRPSAVRGDKHIFDLGREELPDEFTVQRIYVLEYGESVHCAAIPALNAVPLLSRNSFAKCRRMDEEVLRAHLRDCSLVANTVPVHRLVRPRALDALDALVEYVEQDLTQP